MNTFRLYCWTGRVSPGGGIFVHVDTCQAGSLQEAAAEFAAACTPSGAEKYPSQSAYLILGDAQGGEPCSQTSRLS